MTKNKKKMFWYLFLIEALIETEMSLIKNSTNRIFHNSISPLFLILMNCKLEEREKGGLGWWYARAVFGDTTYLVYLG